MRHFPVDAGPATRAVAKVENLSYDAGDYFGVWAFATGFIAFAVFLPLAILVSAWFATGFLPLMFVGLVALIYYTQGKEVSGHSDLLTRGLYAYDKVKSDRLLNQLARPMINNVWAHTVDSQDYHPAHCKVCEPRVTALEKLMPISDITDDDLDAVNRHLEIKKELGI